MYMIESIFKTVYVRENAFNLDIQLKTTSASNYTIQKREMCDINKVIIVNMRNFYSLIIAR
jgi:hypothetical protein